MNDNDTGILLNKKDIELHRVWFKEMTTLNGINVLYRAPRDSKDYDRYGELDTAYYEPIKVACIYDEHPKISTMKKLGWNTELNDSLTLIHVPYDLPKLQVGALFIIPNPLDDTEGRVFKVIKMSTSAVYPASVTCELGPVLKSDFERTQLTDFSKNNLNLLFNDSEDEDD